MCSYTRYPGRIRLAWCYESKGKGRGRCKESEEEEEEDMHGSLGLAKLNGSSGGAGDGRVTLWRFHGFLQRFCINYLGSFFLKAMKGVR